MIELRSTEFWKVLPLFQNIEHSVAIVYAVLETNSPGRVFVDGAEAPKAALLYARGAFFYVAGDEKNADLEKSLVPLVFEEILPNEAEQEMVLFAFSDAWRLRLEKLLKRIGVIQISRIVFRFNSDKFLAVKNWRTGIPAGFHLQEIDAPLADKYPQFRPIVDPASKRFGVCLLHDGEVVSECDAIFVGGGEAEIDIHTEEAYQGRGFAQLTARAFIETCLRRGLKPNWSCWPERAASIALAKRLGFEELPAVPAFLYEPGFEPQDGAG